MKKVLAGCLIVLVIALIGFAGAGYYAFRWMQPMIENAGDYLDRARELSRIGDRVANKTPYVPPASGELTQAQVDRFLAVQMRVRDKLGARWREIEKRSAEIREKTKDGRELTFAGLTSVFSDLAEIYLDVRREQVDALNIHKFSEQEYWWVRLHVYEAAGLEIASGIDVSKFEQLARDNGIPAPARVDVEKMKPSVPPSNTKLVRPHLAKLKESFTLAIIGL